jgi:hypothetical protein
MVPVSVRHDGNGSDLGNQISFIYVDVPCDGPTRCADSKPSRWRWARANEAARPEAADNMLSALSYAPRPIQHAITRMVASPRAFNLVVSNIPGPNSPSTFSAAS